MSCDECHWPKPPSKWSLEPGCVHVWCASLDLPPAKVEMLATTLSADERGRAARFAFCHLRNRFIASRGQLRAVLANYLKSDPEKLQFQYDHRGKPALAPAWQSSGLHFNVSHSQGLALFAVADREVGVDVEWVRPVEAARLVERFFSTEEKRQWRQLPVELQSKAFFHGWTRKEAWLKAVARGLSFPLDRITVLLAPGEPARVISIRGSAEEAATWWLDSFEPAPGYIAALTMRGRPVEVEYWRWAK